MDRYRLRLPNAKRRQKSFVLEKNGHPFDEARISGINRSYLTGLIDFETAKAEANKILLQMRTAAKAQVKVAYPDVNLDILAKATKEYDKRLENGRVLPRTHKMACAGLRRCINVLQDKNLPSISVKELGGIIESKPAVSQPKLAVYFNMLLATAGRSERLHVPEQPDPDVKYLTQAEFIKVLQHIDDRQHKMVAIVAFATGCRLGEIFALTRYGRQASVYVERQMLEGPPWYGPTKTKKKRWVPVMEWGQKIVQEWLAVPEDERKYIRNLEWYEIIRRACKAAFPGQPHKHLTLRDLRHCYAIHWLDRLVGVRHLAQAMGNSERVIMKHYSGFIQTDEGETLMLNAEGKGS